MHRFAVSTVMALVGFGSSSSAALALADAPRGLAPLADASSLRSDPAALVLTVTAACPGGGTGQVSWSGATPDGPVALIYGRELGSFQVPEGGPCGGTMLGLGVNLLRVAFYGFSGSSGSRVLEVSHGPGLCGDYLQLLDLTTCETSNVARIE